MAIHSSFRLNFIGSLVASSNFVDKDGSLTLLLWYRYGEC